MSVTDPGVRPDELSQVAAAVRLVGQEAVQPLRDERVELAGRMQAVETALEAIQRKLDKMSEQFEGMPHRVDALEKAREDHEGRIRKLESMVWKAIGAGLAAGGSGAFAVQALLGG